ncbi:hypothetical protein IU450_35385 [Nocardia abscessus]|uniref:hypothetical protein n=1 Tax=Nocardia abscessus TaxID=120957 RepID=UPI0018945ACA|nr:hypothetical protein [Nocardia abscessus]MBF6341132.1 hypothetical protein [Nocardia abscessus]
MVQVNTIFVVHTTKNERTADTDANFDLQIERPGEDLVLRFPELPHDERARGRTDSYRFDVSGANIDHANLRIHMKMIDTSDGWLPESIFVIGITPSAAHVLLGSHPNWPATGWFDRGDNPAGPSKHLISGFSGAR